MKLTIKGQGQEFVYETLLETINIGRASDNDFVVPLNDFSRKHCVLTIKGGYIFIMDLGSKNGVIIDDKRIPPNVQQPVYSNTRVILANHFKLILPDSTAKTSTGISVEEPALRKK